MKYSVKLFLLSLALMSSIATADVPLPGVEMSAKVRETFLYISQDYQNGNIAQLMQARKNKSSATTRYSVQSDVMHMSVPLLLGTYSNTSAVHSRDVFHDKIFADNPTGTMIDYYREISYGQFELSGQTAGWYGLPQTQAFYNDLNADGARFTLDLVIAADNDVDFSQFDSDADGYVDAVVIVHTGAGAETGASNNIWSHRWSLESAHSVFPADMPQGEYVTNDPRPGHPGQFIKVNDYIIQPELRGPANDGLVEIGVFCHEFGHALGLPDLYDTDNSSAGIGNWGLMAGGAYGGDGRHSGTPTHLCPWSKEFLGWIEPEIINFAQAQREILNSAENRDQIFKVWMNGQSGPEYFLIENRQQIGFDKYVYDGGLLIWHIDEEVIRARHHSNSVNNDENRKGVDLEAADGNADLDRNINRGDAGDIFPGSTSNHLFNSSSNPNSITNLGGDSGVAIQIHDVVDNIVRVNFLLIPELHVTPEERYVAYDAGSIQFNVSNIGGGEMAWTATTADAWLSVDAGMSGVNQGVIVASFQENITLEERTGSILVSVDGQDEHVLLSIIQSAAGEWRLRVDVTDRGGEHVMLQLGRLPTATAGIDDGLGESPLAARPSSGVFDARLILPGDGRLASLSDFRAPDDYIEWRVTFQAGPGGVPIVLSWDPLSLPEGSFFIKDELTGTLISLNMKEENSVSIPTPNMKNLKIIYSSSEPHYVDTKRGWNLLSVPFPADDMSPKSLFPTLISSAFLFDENGYTPVDELERGTAYWLKFAAPARYSMFGTVSSSEILLASGWNMIGPFERALSVIDLKSEPENIIISDFLEFDGDYNAVDELVPGRGYWVKASQDGKIILTGPAFTSGRTRHPRPVDSVESSSARADAVSNAAVDILLTIRDAKGHSTTLWFGLDPTASAGIDKNFEEEVPPLPPAKVFDARFVSEGVSGANLGRGSYKDYRTGDENFVGTVDYELRYQSTDNAKITLSWDLPPHITGNLVDLSTGKIVKKEMVGQDELGVSLVNVIDHLKMTITYKAKSTLAVTVPNGGEVLEIGRETVLTWNSLNVDGPVHIALSRDNGATFEQLATVANTGSYTWTVTEPVSPECLLKISTSDGALVDQSDALFSIDFPAGVQSSAELPTEFSLTQNYPNPFNPSTTIHYSLPASSPVRLVVLNSLGQVIRTLADGRGVAGSHSVVWNGRTDAGRLVASGLYFYRMVAGDFVETRKMVFMP